VAGVVLPFSGTGRTAPRRLLLRVFSPVDVPVDVRVLVIVDVHVAPMPVAMSPRIPPRDADGDPGEKRRPRVWGRVDVIRGVRGVRPHAVHHRGVVRRHVHDLRVGLLDNDDLGILLDHHLLFLRRLQVARLQRLRPERLHGGKNVLLLGEEGVPQFLRPVQLVAHHLEDLGKVHEGFDARVPLLLLEGRGQAVSLEFLVRLHPIVGLRHLQGIRGGHQDLGQQGVRVQRDRGDQLVQLLLGERFGRRLLGALGEDFSRQDEQGDQEDAPQFPGPFLVVHGASCGSGKSGPRQEPCGRCSGWIHDTCGHEIFKVSHRKYFI